MTQNIAILQETCNSVLSGETSVRNNDVYDAYVRINWLLLTASTTREVDTKLYALLTEAHTDDNVPLCVRDVYLSAYNVLMSR